jgi:hypothetical protein
MVDEEHDLKAGDIVECVDDGGGSIGGSMLCLGERYRVFHVDRFWDTIQVKEGGTYWIARRFIKVDVAPFCVGSLGA